MKSPETCKDLIKKLLTKKNLKDWVAKWALPT